MSHEHLGLGEDTWKSHFSLDICRLRAHGPKFGCQSSIAMNQHSTHPFGKINSSLRWVLPISVLASNSGAAPLAQPAASGKVPLRPPPSSLLAHSKARQEEDDVLPPFHGSFSRKQGWESREHPSDCQNLPRL